MIGSTERKKKDMKLNDPARELIGSGADATVVTLNPDGSPQVTVVWMALRSTPDGDELVTHRRGERHRSLAVTRSRRKSPRTHGLSSGGDCNSHLLGGCCASEGLPLGC